MPFDQRDPDAALVAVFKNSADLNPSKTAAAGRPIYDDVEIVEVRAPGSRDMKVFPATSFAGWVIDPYTGLQVARTYAERFAHQYRQFKEHAEQTKTGTPLEFIPFLTAGKRAELKAMNVYTIEALASIDGQELKNLGLGGRELKNKAVEYLEHGAANAANTQLQAQLEAAIARNQALEEDNKLMALKMSEDSCGDPSLDSMTDLQLKDFIGAQTGARPVGAPKRATLLRMAAEAKSKATQAA